MLLEVILFVAGVIFLVNGSGYFVESASTIAKKLGVSDFIIGLTLVAVGTSLPELSSSILASVKHEGSLIAGTIIGANIANLTLLVGIGALIKRLRVKNQILRREGYMLLFSAVLVLIFTFNGVLSRIEGFVFLLIFISYMAFIFRGEDELKGEFGFKEFIPYFFKFQYLVTIKSRLIRKEDDKLDPRQKAKIKKSFRESLVKDFLVLFVSGFFILVGAKFFVNEALFFADFFHSPKFLIGFLIAIGTTLPELSVAVNASRKGKGNIVIGNAIGSCITNTFLVLGVSSLIYPLKFLSSNFIYVISFVLVTVLFLAFSKTKNDISRTEGFFLILLYIVFVLFTLYEIV
jgi:cation:H+ antiporter